MTPMKRYVTDPIELPARGTGAPAFYRADLVFYGVDHSGPSYEGRVFVNAPRANASTPRDDPSYAGSYYVFGHGGCFGDAGHCDVPTAAPDPFDLRPAHQLTPATKTVIVTNALKRIVRDDDEAITVTIVAVTREGDEDDVLALDTVRLLTYDWD
jgi:tyrosinase